MQKGTGSHFGGGFVPHGPGEQQPASMREVARDGSDPVKSFGIWWQTFRSSMSAGIQQARQSRIDGLTKRCYRD